MLSAIAAVFLAGISAGCPAPGDPRPRPAPDLTLTLNIPAFRVDVREGGRVVRSYTVAVGSTRYPTPTGRYRVFSVEMNPWWHPPDSPWARKEKVTAPGPQNPMGRAKLNFHELYFLHGTPHQASLGSAASHGCVRMDNDDAVELARRVLSVTRPDVSAALLDSLVANRRRTRRFEFAPGIPLEVQYRTAEVRDGALELHPDVYRRERTRLRDRAFRALTGAGVDSLSIDPVRLDSAARAGRRHHVRILLADLVRTRSTIVPAARGSGFAIANAVEVRLRTAVAVPGVRWSRSDPAAVRDGSYGAASPASIGRRRPPS